MGTTNSPEADLKTDVQIIREILFGEQIKDLQGRIEALEAEASALKGENNRLRKALADESKARQRDKQAFEEHLKMLIAELSQQLEKTGQSQKKALEELRSSTESLFKKHEGNRSTDLKQQFELITSLMAALDAYKQQLD